MYIWYEEDGANCCNIFFSIIKQRLFDMFVQSPVELINSSSKCFVHLYVIEHFTFTILHL